MPYALQSSAPDYRLAHNLVVVLAAAGCDPASGMSGCTNGELYGSLFDSTTRASRVCLRIISKFCASSIAGARGMVRLGCVS
jgi:hypothetical protein